MSSVQKVLVAPLNYSHIQRGQIEAFEEVFGQENVKTFDFMYHHRNGLTNDEVTHKFLDRCAETRPDWIWLQVQGAGILQPWGFKAAKKVYPKTTITHWMGDLRSEIDESLSAVCASTDATFISSVGQIPMFQDAGAPRVHYVQIGLDWAEDVLGDGYVDIHGTKHPRFVPSFRVPEVVFIGNYYGATFPASDERLACIRYLKEHGIDIGVIGQSWPDDIPVVGTCHVKQQHEVYKRAKVAISINHYNDIERYYSDRQLIAMASGTPVVCRFVPGLDKELTSGVECLFFRDKEVLLDSVRTLLNDVPMRAWMGNNARHHVMKMHSWRERIIQLLPTIDRMREGFIVEG